MPLTVHGSKPAYPFKTGSLNHSCWFYTVLVGLVHHNLFEVQLFKPSATDMAIGDVSWLSRDQIERLAMLIDRGPAIRGGGEPHHSRVHGVVVIVCVVAHSIHLLVVLAL